MKIVAARVLEFRRQLDGRSWNPTFRWHERRAPLVVLDTDAGVQGIGEAWSRQPQIALVLDALARRFLPALVDDDVKHAAEIVARVAARTPSLEPWVAAAAASAIDIALWDAKARAAGLPLWRALGGHRGRVAVYASGGLYRDGATHGDLASEFERYVEMGFTHVKMKIGALSRESDVERARAVRQAIRDDTVLWVDAVNQLSRTSARAWCESLADAGVAAIQAPLSFDDVAGMVEINESILPVVATEAEHREDAFRALVDARAVTFLQHCLGLCGGFSGAMRIDSYAAERGVKSTPQCFSTAVMQAASLHFGAARDNVATVEYHRFHDHLAPLLPDEMKRIDCGFVDLGEAPGLGVAPPSLGEQPGGGYVRLHRQLTRADSIPT